MYILHTETDPASRFSPQSRPSIPALYPKLSGPVAGLLSSQRLLLVWWLPSLPISAFSLSAAPARSFFLCLLPSVSLSMATSLASFLPTRELDQEWFSNNPAFICTLIQRELPHFTSREITSQVPYDEITLSSVQCLQSQQKKQSTCYDFRPSPLFSSCLCLCISATAACSV